MEALPGKVLDSQMALSVPDKHKAKLATQLASYIYELSTTRFNRICRILHPHEDNQFELLPFFRWARISGWSLVHLAGIFLSLSQTPNKGDSLGAEVSKSGKRPLGCLRSG